MMESQNNEHKRRKTDNFWGQIKSTITAQLVMTVVAGILLFFSGYQGMKIKVESLETANSEQRKLIEQLSKDNVSLTKMIIELKATIDLIGDKVINIKDTQGEMRTDLRELRAEVSAFRRGR